MRPHAVFNQRARRALALPVIVLASIATLGGAGSAGFKHASAPVQIRNVSAFARVGDCAEPQEGTACHFVSATTGWHSMQVELTTIEVHDGQEVFTSDVQCNVSHPKISTSRSPLDVRFHDEIAADDCDFLHGETPAPVVVDFEWSSVAPMSSGSNPCDVSATVNGTSLPTLFCSLLVS